MPDPEVPAAESQAAPTPAPAESRRYGASQAAPATEPAPAGVRPSLGTLADAFKADPEGIALKGHGAQPGPRARSDGQADDDASPEESAGPGATAPGAASKPGDTTGTSGPSRRGAAAAIHEKDAEIERLVTERTAEKARAESAAARVAALEQGQEAARRAALGVIGDDEDFDRLQQARLRHRTLSYEEDERLDAMIASREHAATFWELADKAHRVSMAKGIAARADRYGLDRETAFGSDLPGLLDHAVAATEARVRAESAERIADLEAQLKGARPRAAAERTQAPTTGGSSAAGTDARRMPGDGASADEWFRYAVSQPSSQTTSRTGGSHTGGSQATTRR